MGVGRRALGAALLLALLAAGGPGAWGASPPRQLDLHDLVVELDFPAAWPPKPSPPGLTSVFRLAAGDFFGEGRAALAVLYRTPGGAGHQLRVVRPGSPAGPGAPALPLPPPAAEREIADLLADNLVAADVTGNGRAELWFGHSPALGCLEWDGQALSPLQPWKFWQNKPVAVGRLAGTGGAPDQILALGAWYSPEVGIGLISAWWRDKMWGKVYDLRASDFFCPGDRVAAADLNGDGEPELLLAPSPHRGLLPRQPLTVVALREERRLAVMDGVFPEAVATADLDGDGVPEVYVAENVGGAEGEPRRGRVIGLVWDGVGLAEVFRRDFPVPVADLAAGDFAGDGQTSLVAGLVRQVGETPYLSLVLLRLRGEGDVR